MNHSSNLDKLDQEASMQNIDRLIEALEMEARESRMSKCRKLFSDEASNSAPLRFISPLIERSHRLQPLRFISPLLERSHRLQPFRIVPPSKVEVEFLKQTDRKYKKDAWQDIAPWFGFSLTHSQPRSKGWVVDDFKKFSLEGHPNGYALDKQVRLVINQVQRMVGKANHSFYSTTLVLLVVPHVDPRMADYCPDWHMWVSLNRGHLDHGGNDKFSRGKFREGWEAIMRIVTADFLAKQATARHEPLLLKARNAFTNTRAEWDSEKEELVREREALKEELNKAKEMATEAEQRTKAIRLEKEALQQQYTKDKAEWETKNTQLIEEVGQLHEEKKRNAAIEEDVQKELAQIRSLMEQAAHTIGEVGT
ncbi:hypothetical protein R1flu_027795 [Riccia fluitans]|uniref:Uncharacterized protein n=1 Tax=Riccia fluitans TaxID=41844 RepID=A0ABD1XJV1_9MARC